MKRLIALLLGIVLLLTAVPAVPTLADEEADNLNKIAQMVEEEYLLPMYNGEDAKKEVLERCLKMLKDEKGGPKKKPLELYCQVLLYIENNQFDQANQTMFVLNQTAMKKTFDEEFIEKSGGESQTALMTIENLAYYLQGREAENNNDRDTALEAYGQCSNSADAAYRIERIADEQFDDAISLMAVGKYDSAKEILKKLADRQYAAAIAMLRDWSTPTPKPTAKPTATPKATATPKPTATPTPKPTVKPTAKPTATPKITVNLWVETATEDWVALSWEVNRYDVTYELQRQVGSSKVWETIETSQGNYYGFADYPVVVGQTYRYRIVVDGQSLSEVTATIPKPTATPKPTQKITPKPTATQKPSVSISLQLNHAGINSVDLSWTCGTSGVTYEVQRKGGSSSSWTTLATISSKSYTDNSAQAGTKYTYRIVAKSASGTSNEVSVTTLQNSTPTPKPKTWGSWSSWSTNPVSASSTRQVETKVETQYNSVPVYNYSRWYYYNTSWEQWTHSYAQYMGGNYLDGSGKWQYKTTSEPLPKVNMKDGRQQYNGGWWNESVSYKQESYQVTYYRYRDLK